MNKAYVLNLVSYYYDGDETFVLEDVQTCIHVFTDIDRARKMLKQCIQDELDSYYTEDMLTFYGQDYAEFVDHVNGNKRKLYTLEITDIEVE